MSIERCSCGGRTIIRTSKRVGNQYVRYRRCQVCGADCGKFVSPAEDVFQRSGLIPPRIINLSSETVTISL
jgi:hypothetical protein